MVWSDGWNARRNRRDVLRGAAVTAVAGAALTACAGPAGSPSAATTGAAKPTTTFHGVTVVWAPWHNVAFNATLVGLFEQAVQPFTAKNPTIRVQFSPDCCNGGKLVTAALAGQAPDLSSQYNTGTIIAHRIALDLMPYVKEYNLNLADYSAGRISHWEQGGGLYGLPSYTNVYGMIVNSTALDKLGVALPSKKWTHTQARQTFEAATRTVGGRTVAGGGRGLPPQGGLHARQLLLRGFRSQLRGPQGPGALRGRLPAGNRRRALVLRAAP